ncbi:MAG: 5-formyltetrahydrofolate cyclo-ligase [Candidatus Onthomonas sp.]
MRCSAARRPLSRCAWGYTTTTETKAQFRARLRELERTLTPEQRAESDAILFRRFLSLPQMKESKTIFLFYGMGAEPDTRLLLPELLKREKNVLLPRCLPGNRLELRQYRGEEHLLRHRYGMLEPDESCQILPLETVDLALVPALCYDETGMRMGRGGGYYDRFLAGFPGKTVGLCRDVLLQRRVPAESHDRGVNLVLTETRLIAGQRF